jgi:carbon monoxide dehydrogenase subunit G
VLVLELELLLPLGEVAELPLDGDAVMVVSVDFDVELLEVVSDERGVVVVPGDADGLIRSGTVPTRSVMSSSPMILPCGVCFDLCCRLQRPCPWYDANPRPSPRAKEIRGMKLEGSYAVPASRQTVWDAFLDPAHLKQAIPGCEKLEAIGPDEYKATMKVGVGGVKGTFEGKVKLVEKKPPESYKMAVDGSGGPGFIRGETLITLTDAEGGGTRVAYSADVQIGGLIASVGQRMLGGVAKMMADKFFGKMADLLKSA